MLRQNVSHAVAKGLVISSHERSQRNLSIASERCDRNCEEIEQFADSVATTIKKFNEAHHRIREAAREVA